MVSQVRSGNDRGSRDSTVASAPSTWSITVSIALRVSRRQQHDLTVGPGHTHTRIVGTLCSRVDAGDLGQRSLAKYQVLEACGHESLLPMRSLHSSIRDKLNGSMSR